jgi:hypothetical protein
MTSEGKGGKDMRNAKKNEKRNTRGKIRSRKEN